MSSVIDLMIEAADAAWRRLEEVDPSTGKHVTYEQRRELVADWWQKATLLQAELAAREAAVKGRAA